MADQSRTEHNKAGRGWSFLVGRLTQIWSQAWVRRIVLLAVGVALLAIPKVWHSNYWMRILDQAGLSVIMALGLNIIAGYTGLINLGYAAFYAVGAYMWALLASNWSGNHYPFLFVFPLAGVVAGLLGAVLARPVVGLSGDYLCVVTIAFGEIVRLLANNLALTGGALGITAIDPPRFFGITIKSGQDYYYLILAMCFVLFVLINRLEKSKIGRQLMALREDEEAAKAVGIDTTRLKVIATVIGSIPAGMAGVVFAALQTFVSPVSFSVWQSVAWLSMLIVGGVGNAAGVATGAAALTILTEPLRAKTESYRMLIYGAILVAFAVLRPQGIWPKRYTGLDGTDQAEPSAASDPGGRPEEG